MACLSQEQLVHLAKGLTDDADLTAHLKECSSCREREETMRSFVHQLTVAHAKFDSGHEEARERLMALLPPSRPLEPTRSRNRITHWIGELTMRQRIIALSGVSAAAILAILLLWLGSAATPVSAMEKMAESIRKAKSYKMKESVQVLTRDDPGKQFVKDQQTDIVTYWMASGSTRKEITYSRRGIEINGKTTLAPTWKGPGPETIQIYPPDKLGICIDNQTKTFARFPGRWKQLTGTVQPENWSNLSVEADRDLGIKEINGKKAHGFEMDIKKISPNYPDPGIAEIWIDLESNLPVHARYNIGPGDILSEVWFIVDFQWNIDLDPKLFDPIPPEGYTDATKTPPTLEEQVSEIIKSFNIYAEEIDGRYPSEDGCDFAQTANIKLNAAKYDKLPKPPPVSIVKKREEKIKKAEKGWLLCSELQHYNSAFAYHGNSVSPQDKDKVLLRWKLDNGKYAIIYGDLHYETVTAEKLHSLEGK
ncbi:MAG: hypothetical protein ABSA77_00605 [Thermoguttaceae bacterium]|jgi:outer membrane lipoprotein-sorting protein